MKIMRLLRHGKKSKYLKYTTICVIIENELVVEWKQPQWNGS